MKIVRNYELGVKSYFLTVLGVVVLLLCATTCKKNSEPFAKNIPECIKQHIKGQSWVISADEYYNKDDIKRIYIFNDHPSSKVCLIGYDENCNFFFIKSDDYNCMPLNPDEWVWGEMLPDGTIEYKEDIYLFKRVVFTKT